MIVKINRSTGDFLLGDQSLGRNLSEEEFVGSALGTTAQRVRNSGTRRYYEIWRHINAEREVGVTLGFPTGGVLQRISAKFLKSEVRAAEWSKSLENEIKILHDQWLRAQLGSPPYQFRWGKVISAIDQHGYSANVVIDYTETS